MDKTERPLALANRRYERHRQALRGKSLEETFSYIHQHNVWGSRESESGVGSELEATRQLRLEIPRLLRQLGAGSLLDIPCGDFGWMQQVDLGTLRYIGADIVPAIVERNQARYANPQRQFQKLDLTSDDLPQVDVVLCRDCLVHFSFATVFRAFANLKRSGSGYLLATTFPDLKANLDIEDGDWWAQNLERPPFSLPRPLALINEGCLEEDGAYADKSLGLWAIADLP